MLKKSALAIGLVLSLGGCAAADKTPTVDHSIELERCRELAHDKTRSFYDTLAYFQGFSIKSDDVQISNLSYADLGNSKGRITGTYVLALSNSSERGIDGSFVCAVDGASVELEDWD